MSSNDPGLTPAPGSNWHLAYARMLENTEHPVAAHSMDEKLDQPRPQLLVVDDQAVNIQVLNQVFQQDHDVFMATSGRQALDMCLKHQPDLVLLDVVMPGMDGYEVCRQLKKDPRTRDIPVIFVTSQDNPFDETQAFAEGGVDFINKPVNAAVVRARVHTHLTIKAQADLLRRLAFIDGLTGVANRRHFDEQFDAEWNAARRNGTSLGLILLDVDDFKAYNDNYGHEQGDFCLRQVAYALNGELKRGRDLLARYGGEEFVALLPNTDLQGAQRKAEDFRMAVTALQIAHAHARACDHVSISLGVSAVRPGPTFTSKSLLQTADKQLYRAKAHGRNTVCSRELRL